MVYRIKIAGLLDQSWAEWLGGVKIVYEPQEDGSRITTLIVDAVDQPALFGILDRIRDLNLVLINVSNNENEIE